MSTTASTPYGLRSEIHCCVPVPVEPAAKYHRAEALVAHAAIATSPSAANPCCTTIPGPNACTTTAASATGESRETATVRLLRFARVITRSEVARPASSTSIATRTERGPRFEIVTRSRFLPAAIGPPAQYHALDCDPSVGSDAASLTRGAVPPASAFCV